MIAAALAVSLGAKPRRLKDPGPTPIVPGSKVYLLKPDGTSPAKEGRLIITPHTELYDDDGKSEPEIPEDELRACAPGTPPGAPARETASAKLDSPKSPLERSLCDDSWEAPEPVAFTHKVSHGSGGAFVVNGNETKLGAGGGLRGIRFLRESVNMQ